MPRAGEVEEIDARGASDDTLARFHAIELACHDELRLGEPPRSRDEAIAFYRHQPATHVSCHWLGRGGAASLYVYGPTAAFVDLLVDPAHRRRGVGSAMLERVLERCRDLEVAALHGGYVGAPGRAFARHVGASDELRSVRSLLDLSSADLPQAAPPSGFRLVTWLGRVPDEHLPAYVRARVAMDDAPAPEDMELPTWTAGTVRASEASLAQREREMRLTVAVDVEGEIGAFTELRVSRGSTLGFTDDTGTVAAHRGKGLARAVKLESLGRLRADHPEVEVVSTSNAETNTAIRRLNESIGFRPTAVVTGTVLRLSGG